MRDVAAIDWKVASADLDEYGCATIRGILTRSECEGLAKLYNDENMFRSRIVMARHGFGRGEYKYFDYPLPEILATLRPALYPRLVTTANRWNTNLGIDVRFP